MADALRTLARLHHLRANQARRALADALAAERDAERAVCDAAQALVRETAAAPRDAADPLFAFRIGWLPAVRRAEAGAAVALLDAAGRTQEERDGLGRARAAAARAGELRTAQRETDDWAVTARSR